MAQANKPKVGCLVARTVNGASPTVLYYPEGRAAARTWTGTALVSGKAVNSQTSTTYARAGAMVFLNTTRGIDCWPGDAIATGYDGKAARLLGLLLEDITGTTTNRVAIAIADHNNIFETSIVSETATTTATTSATLVGYRMHASCTASRFYLDRTASAPSLTAGPFLVVDVDKTNGTLYGRVQFIAKTSYFK